MEFERSDSNMADNENKKIARPSYKKRFLARKIHKLKKMLKLTSTRKFAKVVPSTMSLEEMQNMQNESDCRLQNECNEFLESFYKGRDHLDEADHDFDDIYEFQNAQNENWENWDQCCPCAIASTVWEENYRDEKQSICFVFMPNEARPVPVKLRSTKIPGGFMWVSYGLPDVDIYSNNVNRWVTSSQIPQQQSAPIIV